MCASFAFSHPAFDGLEMIGEGEYSRVYALDEERVLKVMDCAATHAFLTDSARPRNRHYPIVHRDYGEVGRTDRGHPLYMVEMERLQPLEVGSLPWALAGNIARSYEEGCRSFVQFGESMTMLAFRGLLRTPLGLSEDLSEALASLYRFVEDNQLRADFLKTDNIMVRRDGTLVFSDPVFV